MKSSTRQSALRKRKQQQSTEARTGRQTDGNFLFWGWVWLTLGLIVAGCATLSYFEFFIWNKVPPALAGKWKVSEGAKVGGTFEFFRDGNLVIQLKDQKQDYPPIKGRAFVEGKTLQTFIYNPTARREQTQTSTISELTAHSLILEFDNGDVVRMIR